MSETPADGLPSMVARVTAAMEARPVPMDPREIRLEVGRSGDDMPLKDVIAALTWMGARGMAQRVSKKWLAEQGLLDPEYPHRFGTAWRLVERKPPRTVGPGDVVGPPGRVEPVGGVGQPPLVVLGAATYLRGLHQAAVGELIRRHAEEFVGIVDALLDADGRLP